MATPMANRRAKQSTSAAESPHLAWNPAQYSKEHHYYIDLMAGYFEKVRRQEEMYVKAGFPAEGITDFLIKLFDAWEQRSVLALRDCYTDDMEYADPSIGSRTWQSGQMEYDLYNLVFKLVPDLVFYPQDDTPRALPYFDFLDGNVRITVPYMQVGRVKFTPRAVKLVGVDRYNLVRDPERGWLISRIDTDGDMLGAIGQMLPIPIRAPKQKTVRFIFGAAQKLFPRLRGPRVRPLASDLR